MPLICRVSWPGSCVCRRDVTILTFIINIMPSNFRRNSSCISSSCCRKYYSHHFCVAETQAMLTAFIDVFCVLQYDNIDAEHKAIFECIFNCSKDPKSAPLISKLYQVTEDHFKDEEVPYRVLLLYH